MTVDNLVRGRGRTATDMAIVAHRLAIRLGCSHAVLAAPEHLGDAGPLSGPIDVRFLARSEDLEEARAHAGGLEVIPLEECAGVTALPLERTLLVLTPAILDAGAGTPLYKAAEQAAAVIVSASRHWAPGAAGALRLRRLAGERGLQIVHAGLLRATGDPGSRRESPFVVAAGPVSQERVDELLKAGPHSLALDPDVDIGAAQPRPARVCIASYEVVGPTRNGGIGTANTSLAQALARAGHEVSLLYTGPEDADPKIDVDRWREHYRSQGIAFDVLRGSSRAGSPHPNVRRSYELYEWLLGHECGERFDVVHFPDCQGHGYFPVLAKRYGLAFESTLLVAGVHSPTRWVHEANREPIRWIEQLVDDHLERVSVAHADVLISPSAYLIDYMQERGWAIPDRWFVQQYVLPPSAVPGDTISREPASELVFFGRLEVRKGLEAFCDALDLIAEDRSDLDLRISFLGSLKHILSEPAERYVERRADAWPWRWQIMSDLSQPEAIAYLRSRPCVAVMPSLVDNSPNTVTEALSLGLPIVTSRTGGTGELIHIEDLERSTFDGWTGVDAIPPFEHGERVPPFDTRPLADRLLAVIGQPARPARFAIDPQGNEEVYVRWHAGVAATRPVAEAVSANVGPRPRTVSVCVINRDDTRGLPQTWSGVERQTAAPLEVVVVDETGGTGALTGRELDAAVERLTGEVVVFLRAGDCPQPDLVKRLGELAARTEAGALAFPVWNAVREHAQDGAGPSLLVPVGGPATLGLAYPAFSVGSFAIRREAFARLGGFAPDARGDEAEHDLLNRFLLGGGRLEVVPVPLATRVTEDSWASVRTAPWVPVFPWAYDSDQQLRLVRAFSESLPPDLRELPALLRGLHDGDVGIQSKLFEQRKHLRLQHERLQELEAWILHLETEFRSRQSPRTLAARLRQRAGAIRRRVRRLRQARVGEKP